MGEGPAEGVEPVGRAGAGTEEDDAEGGFGDAERESCGTRRQQRALRVRTTAAARNTHMGVCARRAGVRGACCPGRCRRVDQGGRLRGIRGRVRAGRAGQVGPLGSV